VSHTKRNIIFTVMAVRTWNITTCFFSVTLISNWSRKFFLTVGTLYNFNTLQWMYCCNYYIHRFLWISQVWYNTFTC
jgi:hypothetical protein